MPRNHNTDRNGTIWSDVIKKTVWKKGRTIPQYSPDIWRWDKCGVVMNYSEYGNRNSEHGWEIDHIKPVSSGGSNDLSNLQPLNWKNNADKGDNIYWDCR
jgi:5-methylcytosine-specific restriction endonuclease McrA